MKFSMKFLPAIALAMALAPFAAQAQNATQTANGCYPTVVQSGLVMTGSATIDNPTTIYSGRIAQKFPVSDGG